jgi:hypothetical protein
MQTYTLIRDFRDFEIGDTFKKFESGQWQLVLDDGTESVVSNSVMDTLLDVGGYLEDITPTEWTPVVGSTVYVITGAGEVKSKEFSNSDWFRLQKEFMGYFATREEALQRVEFIRGFLTTNQ